MKFGLKSVFSCVRCVARGFTVWAENLLLPREIRLVYATLCFYLYVFSLDILLFVPFCFLYIQVKFYSCFFVQYLFVLYVSFCVSFGRILNRFDIIL